MGAHILDGRALATELRSELLRRSQVMRAVGVEPTLAVVVVGDDASSAAYIRGLTSLATKIGVGVEIVRCAADHADDLIYATLEQLGANDRIHGIILQQPLPPGHDSRAIIAAIPAHKDVDGANPVNAGRLAVADGSSFVPATPAAVMLLLERSRAWPLRGKNVVVLGRSRVVGLPVALLALARDATVTIAHRSTSDLPAVARGADVLIAAVGRPHLVDSTWIKPGAVVIDVGTTVVDGALRGDVDFESVTQVAGEITPVPGGVGPVTNIALLRNLIAAAEAQTNSG